jgi:DNA-binding NarL/FixJ family response regulator
VSGTDAHRAVAETMTIRVLVADHQVAAREGVKAALKRQRDIEIVGEAGSGREAVERARTLSPDIVVIDVATPDGSGPEAARAIRQRCPKAQILVLTSEADVGLFRRAAAAGAKGYVLKDISAANLAAAIRTVQRGGAIIAPAVARKLVAEFAHLGGVSAAGPVRRASGLTQREIEILVRVAQGLSDRQVATALMLSQSTVKGHLRTIYRRLNIRNRARLTTFAIASGLLTQSAAARIH